MSRPGCVVAAVRQRQPQVQRPDRAHELAVLMPGARDRRLGLAQGRLLRGDQRRLTEVSAHQLRQLGLLEQLHHREVQQRRIDRQHAAALLDPWPCQFLAVARIRGELLVQLGVVRNAGVVTLAFGERTVDLLGEPLRVVAVDEAPHQQAPVAQDRRAQQLRRDLITRELRQGLAHGQRGRGGGERRVARCAAQTPDPRLVAQVDQLALVRKSVRCPRSFGQALDLELELRVAAGVFRRRFGDGDRRPLVASASSEKPSHPG